MICIDVVSIAHESRALSVQYLNYGLHSFSLLLLIPHHCTSCSSKTLLLSLSGPINSLLDLSSNTLLLGVELTTDRTILVECTADALSNGTDCAVSCDVSTRSALHSDEGVTMEEVVVDIIQGGVVGDSPLNCLPTAPTEERTEGF